eukprot:474231-Prorocentrum_minimum.AAC.3
MSLSCWCLVVQDEESDLISQHDAPSQSAIMFQSADIFKVSRSSTGGHVRTDDYYDISAPPYVVHAPDMRAIRPDGYTHMNTHEHARDESRSDA